MAHPVITRSLQEGASALDALLNNATALSNIERASGILIAAFEKQGRVFSCGNGGSMSDAMHFAEELSGRYQRNRKALGATAISDPGHLSCVANDFGYEYVFSRYIEGNGRAGDVLFGISTSGSSQNIINAAESARANGMRVITLTGKPGSKLAAVSDCDICTPGGGKFADRIQELHIKVIHILIELVERRFYPENYAD